MKELTLQWIKSTENSWCPLHNTNMSNVSCSGVYIIWNNEGKIVRVGQGDVCARLAVHGKDTAILAHKAETLYMTWASVEASYINGVERYLGDTLKPLVAERFPDAQPIVVNLPW